MRQQVGRRERTRLGDVGAEDQHGESPTENRIRHVDAIGLESTTAQDVQHTRGYVDQRRLVERAAKGDHDAFADLARVAVVRLDQVARLILRDTELARDAVQDGLIRAWRDLPGLRDPDRFDAWLHRLVTNACLDLVRRRRRRPVEVELVPIHAPSMADAAVDFADRDLVDGVLRRLDERSRAIVVLHYYVGLPLTDVAATLGIPVGTVKSRLHRALGEMRVAISADRDATDRTPVTGGQLA